MSLPRLVRRALPLFLLGIAAACSRDVASPKAGRLYPATLHLVPLLPSLSGGNRVAVAVDSVNVAVTNAHGDTLGVEGVAFPSGQDSVVVRVDVVLDSATQTVTAHVDVLANGQVVFRQVLQVVASVSGETTSHSDSVPLVSAVWEQQEVEAQTALAGRVGFAAVYDAGQKEIVGFGGATTAGVIGETWTLQGDEWEPVPGPGPAARVGHGMVYDAARGVTVLFGGALASGFGNDTWAFNAATDTWTQIATTGTPPARGAVAMAYDAARGRIVMFGGYSGAGFLNETWEFRWTGSASGAWVQVSTTQAPLARAGTAMVYDAALGKTVLFGGVDANLNALNDTWTYDGTAWVQVCTACGPSPRAAHGMAYDPGGGGRVLLFGGANTKVDAAAATSNTGVDTTRHNDVWAFNGTSWAQLWADNPSAGPSKRAGMAVAWDLQQGLVVISGLSAVTLESDTWVWNGAWTSKATAKWLPRSQHAMAYDTRRGVAIMFGGTAADTVTWLFDGLAWRPVALAGPGSRSAPAMAYDTGAKVIVLFGGTKAGAPLADTWTYDGLAWTLRTTTGAPPARSGTVLVYDGRRGKVVMYGGQGVSGPLSDTWEYSTATATWVQVNVPAAPPARAGAAAGFDTRLGKVVLFGGTAAGGAGLGDTGVYDGASWTHVTTAHAPSVRSGAVLAFEAARGKSVLFGGRAAAALQNDLWVFDGTDWTQLYAPASPGARTASAMVGWAGGSLLLFGGWGTELPSSGTPTDLRDTWLFQ